MAESLEVEECIKDRIMKKILGTAAVVAIVLTACADGETGQREIEMQDNAVAAPTTSPQSNTTAYDSSTSMDVRDSTTTMGYDTSRKQIPNSGN